MFKQELKIPKERIAVLIGTKGEIKKKIENKANVIIDVDSKEGDVIISGEDSFVLYITKDVVSAIGRGFAPKDALKLFQEGCIFDILNITEYVGKSKKGQRRIRGRVIGSEGKARKMIEDLTDTKIIIYHKTVGIIGEVEKVSIARRAVDMLLSGAPHGNVYRWLENKIREIEKRVFEKEHEIKEAS
ncbi:MAG: KH domain-containing protein [Nanoarchaeota archaeon]|nr:KH domain-containing protein [Nanoarchaeota archaeon]